MIISLDEAQKIDANITPTDLNAYEQTVRQLTNNKFQNLHIRYHQLTFTEHSLEFKTSPPNGEPIAIRSGDTIQVSDSKYNDGLYVVKSIEGKILTLDNNEPFFNGSFSGAFITKIEYPPDIRMGIVELIKYKQKMGSKMGIKSESIARMSVTYYDINATDNIEGFPASKFSFLNKYKKMRWG